MFYLNSNGDKNYVIQLVIPKTVTEINTSVVH